MADKQGANVKLWYVNGGDGYGGDTPADNTTSNRGEAPDNAWDTIQFAFDKIADGTVNDGDEIRIMATANYSIGTALNPAWDLKEITITGANSTGGVDGTQAVLIATSSITAILDIGSGECERLVWANLHFDGDDKSTYCVYSAGSNHYQKWLNCRFSQATSHGVYKLTNYWDFIKCRFDNNGGDGMRMDATSFQVCYKCLFDNNALCGVDTGTENAYRHKWIECVFYNNGDIGLDASGSGSIICNNIFDSNGDEGLRDRGSSIQTFREGNIYSNNGQAGVNYHTNTDSVAFNELFYNNTVGDTEDTSGGSEAISELAHLIDYVPGASAENPNYTDAANFDFTPKYTFGAMGTGVAMPYKVNGSTDDDIGLNKWIDTESKTIF